MYDARIIKALILGHLFIALSFKINVFGNTSSAVGCYSIIIMTSAFNSIIGSATAI